MARFRPAQLLSIQNQERWSHAAGDHLRHVVDGLQAQGFDAGLAQFCADGAAQIPFAGDDENDRHLHRRTRTFFNARVLAFGSAR